MKIQSHLLSLGLIFALGLEACGPKSHSNPSTSPDRTLTFDKPSGPRSWSVHYSGPYLNSSRPPHVEAQGFTPKVGVPYPLTNLHVLRNAVVWDVVGVTNQGAQAHFTVYYGTAPHNHIDKCK